ncbi:MAG: IPT/TIG domain-containing protein [Thermoplasmatota archaeon]
MRVPLPTFLIIAALVLAGLPLVPGATAAPAVTTIVPSTGSENGGTPITISGSGFSPGASVCLTTGTAPCDASDPELATQVVVSGCTSNICNKITALTPSRSGVTGDTPVNVIVRNQDSQATLVTNGFTFQQVAGPTVTSVTPTSATSNGGTTVTIKGANYDKNVRPTVLFGSTAAPVVLVVDDNTLSVVTPPHSTPTPAGSVNLQVIYPSSTGSSNDNNLENGFHYQAAPQPTLSSVSPTSGGTNGGNRVTITGANFAPGASVTFGSTLGTQVVFTSTSSLSVLAPATPAAGAVHVVLTNPDGQTRTLLSGYNYVASADPTVSAINPTFGPRHGGEVIGVIGTNFVPGTVLCTDNPASSCGTLIEPIGTPEATLAYFPVPAGTTPETFWVLNPDGSAVQTPSFTYQAATVLTSLTASNGPANGGTPVTLSGEGFECGGPQPPLVEFGGTAAFLTSCGATSLVVLTPGHASGQVDVRVRNPSGLVALFQKAFTYDASVAPTFATTNPVLPTSGHANGGFDITIAGTGFGCSSLTGPLPTVTIGTKAVTRENITSCSATEVVVKAPAHASGAQTVKVRSPSGQEASKTTAFTYTSAAPSIGTMATSPVSSPVGGSPNGGTTLTITGAGFTCGDNGLPTVLFGSTPAFSVTPGTCTATNGGTTNTLTVITPGHATGTVRVTVRNPSSEASPDTSADDFVYTAAVDPPTIQSITPNAFGESLGGESRTINGANFACTGGTKPTVSFGGVLVDPANVTMGTCASGFTSTMTVRAPPHALGAVNLVVTNPSGQAVTLTGGYNYNTASGGPTINTGGLSSTRGSVLGGARLVITGANFYCAPGPIKPIVTIGGTVVPAADVSYGTCADNAGTTGIIDFRTTQLIVKTPAHTAMASASVIVINPDQQQGSLSGGFRYLDQPTVTSVSPLSGSTLGGPLVTITGTNFEIGGTALFDTFPTPAAAVPSATSALVETPQVPIGLADVTYIDPFGQSATLANAYTFTQSVGPTASSLSPTQGSVVGGTTVAFTGANIGSGAIVCFGPLVSQECPDELKSVGATTMSDGGTKLVAVTPPHSLGSVDVTIINPDGQPGNTVPQAYTFLGTDQLPIPTITTVQPSSGPQGGGTVVTINGTNLAASAKVKFGGVNATAVEFVSATSIKATTPQHAAGAVDVVVTIDAQSVTKTGGFTYTSSSTTDSGSSTTTTTGTGTGTGTGTSSSSGTGTPTAPQILAANKRIEFKVTRDGDANVITWDLPTGNLPGTVQGVQIWRSNSPYSLVRTLPSSSADFTAKEFRDTGAQAKDTTKYLVTMYYGATPALGLFTSSSAPDTADYPGTASIDGSGGDGSGTNGLPTWAIVLIALGILFLVVLVAVLIARGRNRDGQQAAAQGYAWQEEGEEAKAAEGEWQPPAEVHQARCPACATSFTATGQKPIVTVCPGCGKKGILR